MNNKKLIDFYLPYPWNIHARILFFSFLGSSLFWLFNDKGNYFQFLLIGMVIMVLDGEIIYWTSKVLFDSANEKTPKKFTIQILWRVVVFWLVIILVGTTVASAAITGMNLSNGNSWGESLTILKQFEIKSIINSLIIASLIATFIFFFMLWQEAMQNYFTAREQALVYQNETLKNQVNPHFLFNSLNTLSSLIPTNPIKAEAFTQKLSLIYRYILENREVETVSLGTELEFVRDFYFLQKIRDEEKIELFIDVSDFTCRVLPISIQLLVENAFKHNMATREMPLKVNISQHNGFIEVKNNLQPKKQLGNKTGIGLKNLSERISLFTGKELQIFKSEKEFVVHMPLNTNDKNQF